MRQYDFLVPAPTAEKLHWGFRYLMFSVIFLPRILQTVFILLSVELSAPVLNFLYVGIDFGVMLALFGKYFLNSLQAALSHPRRTVLTFVAGFCVYWTVNILMGIRLSAAVSEFSNINDQTVTNLTHDSLYLTILTTVVMAPFTEEFMFRTVLFRSFFRHSAFAGYSISILCFCAVHVIRYIGIAPAEFLLLSFLQYIPAGVCLAVSYQLGGSVIVPIAIHAAVNAIGIFITR